MSFSPEHQVLYNVKFYMYKETFPFMMPLLGKLVGVIDTLPFIRYTVVGQGPVLCPLYCSTQGLEAVQQHIKLTAYLETRHVHAPALNAEKVHLPRSHGSACQVDQAGPRQKIHIVYDDIVDFMNFQTMVHWADYPSGYNMPVFNFGSILDMSDIIQPDQQMTTHSLTIGLHWMSIWRWKVMAPIHIMEHLQFITPTLHHILPILHLIPSQLHLMHLSSKRRTPIMMMTMMMMMMLAYLQLLFRVAICTGNSVNPHEITTSKPQFIYDTAQVANWAIDHHEAGFGLHDIFDPVIQAKLEMLLENFLHSKSDLLPINMSSSKGWSLGSTYRELNYGVNPSFLVVEPILARGQELYPYYCVVLDKHTWLEPVDGYLLFQECMVVWHWNHKRLELEAQFWKHIEYFPFKIKIDHMKIRALQIQLSWYHVGKFFWHCGTQSD
ncbi:uncharacterized protein HD556DRAFT_1311119 [Suillus plorans]|uniref:Uncharacterized protein n=1 Tax=Suillus plorans TaxID=116603 RepID=A0A9P7AJM1_9AGAM|nr:uncharacterized protein HD556DRAFT_1311119 [Suillus plorans]KAG1789719.1 hypothetical protein HD556DRAFT_1311119 [Suillus plorans]